VGGTIYDSVVLTLKIRVPTNARSFHYDADFYSAHHPEAACVFRNDSFLALLTTKAGAYQQQLANDVAVYASSFFNGAAQQELGTASPFFEVCQNCARGRDELLGTGYDTPGNPSMNAATSWLVGAAPVFPGEIATLKLVLFEADGQAYWGDSSWTRRDSTIVLDNFRWDTTPDGPIVERR
jgi:hypothetical protein